MCIRQMIVVGGYPIPIHGAQHMAGLALAMLNLCTRKAKKLLKKLNSQIISFKIFIPIINQINTPNFNQKAVRFSATNIVLEH